MNNPVIVNFVFLLIVYICYFCGFLSFETSAIIFLFFNSIGIVLLDRETKFARAIMMLVRQLVDMCEIIKSKEAKTDEKKLNVTYLNKEENK